MTAAARTKAERCFALARSTKFDGERDNAIAQGTRIAEAAGLSLDLFDIPGRSRKAAPKPEPRKATMGAASYSAFHEFGGRGGSARGFGFDTTGTTDDLADAIRQMRERTRASAQALSAADYLRTQGASVQIIPDSVFASAACWQVKIGNVALPPMTNADLTKLADDIRKASEARDRKRAYEAGRQPERCARCGWIIVAGLPHSCRTNRP